MIIVSLEGCHNCELFKSRHSELRVIEIPRSCEGDKMCQNVKKVLRKFNIETFPVVMNDGLTQVIPLENIDPEFAKIQND